MEKLASAISSLRGGEAQKASPDLLGLDQGPQSNPSLPQMFSTRPPIGGPTSTWNNQNELMDTDQEMTDSLQESYRPRPTNVVTADILCENNMMSKASAPHDSTSLAIAGHHSLMTEPAAINALTTEITSHTFASSSFGYPSTTVPPQILGPQNTQINIGTLVAADAEYARAMLEERPFRHA